MILLITDLCNTLKIILKKIQCDNSGENVAFQAAAKKKDLGLSMPDPTAERESQAQVFHTFWKGLVNTKLS